MKRLRHFLATMLALFTLGLAGGCMGLDPSSGRIVASAPDLGEASETRPEAALSGPALWKVANEDTTIFLFGTVHALPPELEWLDGRIAHAFAESRELVLEIDMNAAAASAARMQARGSLPAGQNLRAMMAEKDLPGFETALASLSLPPEVLDGMRPWLAALTLSLLPMIQHGYAAESGVELALLNQPGVRELSALETMDQQIDLLASLSNQAQLGYLQQTVAAVPHIVSMVERIVAHWAAGEAAELGAVLNTERSDPELHQRLLIDRNIDWADWTEQRLTQPGTVFMAVGAGHLAGSGSLQEQLRARGYRVERVWE